MNSVLAYGHVRLKHLEPDEVCDSLLAIFEASEFGEAKDYLWKHLSQLESDCACLQIIGEKQNRIKSQSRTEEKAHCQDILKALQSLQDAKVLPVISISVEHLVQLPPIAPTVSNEKRSHAVKQQISTIEEELHHSQNEVRRTLAAIEDAQKKMTDEMAHLRHKLETLHDIPEMQDTSPDPRSSTPDPKKLHTSYPLRPSYANAANEGLRRSGQARQRAQISAPLKNTEPRNPADLKRKRLKVVTGTQKCENSFCSAPEVGCVFVSNVMKNTQLESVRKHLDTHCDGVKNVRQWSLTRMLM